MEVKFVCTDWGLNSLPLPTLAQRIKDAGFDGMEAGTPMEIARRRELRAILEDHGLLLIAQLYTAGRTAEEHAQSFEAQYRAAVELKPVLVNAHTGKDYFRSEENLLIMRKGAALEKAMGVPVAHETHRGRAAFSAPATMALLEAMPDLRLTADFSHWCCVHESLLEDQQERVTAAIARSVHIHARVGHAEGPQVTDPRAPEWSREVETHVGWWQRIIDARRQAGASRVTICSEFGPPNYMATLPYTRQPVADQWEINGYMRETLKELRIEN